MDVRTEKDLINAVKFQDRPIDITIRGSEIKEIRHVVTIGGTLGLSETVLMDMGTIKEVRGDLWVSNRKLGYSSLETLSPLERVEGDLNLRYSNVRSTGTLKYVGGKLSLRDTPIEQLNSLEYVGGDLFLPLETKGVLSLPNDLTVAGKIRYWRSVRNKVRPKKQSENELLLEKHHVPSWEHKYIFSTRELNSASNEARAFFKEFKKSFYQGKYFDIAGQSNYAFVLYFDILEKYQDNNSLSSVEADLMAIAKYYPIVRTYAYGALVEILCKHKEYEKAFGLSYQAFEHEDLEHLLKYQTVIDRSVALTRHLLTFGGKSGLTDYGKERLGEIGQISQKMLKKAELAHPKGFYGILLYGMQSGALSEEYPELTAFLKKYAGKVKSFKDEYKPFFYRDLTNRSKLDYLRFEIPNSFKEAMQKSLSHLYRRIENELREKNGIPRIGEGWISETELFNSVNQHFSGITVVQHGSPNWLGRQHLDVFIPSHNIALEYQGKQHQEPVEFFGGKDAFRNTKKRDEKKRKLCEENGCTLIYVYPNYDLNDILIRVETLIEMRNK